VQLRFLLLLSRWVTEKRAFIFQFAGMFAGYMFTIYVGYKQRVKQITRQVVLRLSSGYEYAFYRILFTFFQPQSPFKAFYSDLYLMLFL